MARRRNKKKEEEGMDESWLLPYADILTLLLALFIVLYSMSSVDAKKFSEISQALNSVFVGEKSILDESAVTGTDMPDSKDKEDEKIGEKNNDESDEEQLTAEQLIEKEALAEVQKRVDDYILNNSLSKRFETSLTKQGLLITIRDNVLFESGSAQVRNKDKKTATELSDLLYMDPPREIIISGHTDNVPINTAVFESNWELSVSRAVNFMKLILANEKLDSSRFSAKGYGEHQPIASNKTAEGKAKNRRVEILILPLVELNTGKEQ